MFTWLNKQGVQNDKGYIVQCIGRFEIEYREDKKRLSIYIEHGNLRTGKPCVIIRSEEFNRWEDGIQISDLKKKEILKNFKDAMEFQGIGVEVWNP